MNEIRVYRVLSRSFRISSSRLRWASFAALRYSLESLRWRKHQGLPWHRPPHRASEKTRYHLTAACFEHRPFIGHSMERMERFCGTLLDVLRGHDTRIHAWCVEHWQDWPFSSAQDYLSGMGREEAARIWKDYPVLDYGKGWDEPEL